MKLALFALVLFMLPSSVKADDLRPEIARCAALSGDLERLECFDQLARRNQLDGPQEAAARIEGVGKWQVSDRTNPIDDSRTITLVLTADSGRSRFGNPIALILRCQSNTTELYINWHSFLGREANVLTRLGNEDAVTNRWSLSTDSQATFHPRGAIDFIKQMLQSTRLVAQVTPYSESPITAIFDTTGLENAITPLRETCGW
jgi:type VI secretion system protein VasI